MQNNQSVVRILYNRAWRAFDQRMADNRNERRLLQDAFEDVSNNDEEVRYGERGSPCRRPLRQLIHLPGMPLRSTAVLPVRHTMDAFK